MENPATHGKAEKIVSRVLAEFWDNQARAVTDPDKIMIGLSLERLVTDALREEGLLHEDEGYGDGARDWGRGLEV